MADEELPDPTDKDGSDMNTGELLSGNNNGKDKEDCLLSCEDRQLISKICELMIFGSEEETLDEITKNIYEPFLSVDIPVNCSGTCECVLLVKNFILAGSASETVMKMILSGSCEHVTPESSKIQVLVQLIHIATMRNLINVTDCLLKIGNADVNAVIKIGSFCYTPIFIAISLSHIDLLLFLINYADADINCTGFGVTALTAAIDKENNAAVRAILSRRDCDINQVGESLETPLKHATRNKCWEIAEDLIKAGADVNIPDIAGTPIFDAIRNELPRPDMVEMLIKAGANVDVKTRVGDCPLIFAIYAESVDICRMLLDAGANPDSKTYNGYLALWLAANNDLCQIIKLLLSYGADVNAVDDTLYSALHMAAWEGNIDSVRILLNVGAHHDKRTKDGNTPMALAAHGNHHDVMELLLSKGCNVNNADKDADTPIHYASFNGNLKSVISLVEAGADPNVQSSCNATPLWNAVYQNSVDVVRYLIRRNVDLEVLSRGTHHWSNTDDVVYLYDSPKSPFEVAIRLGHHEIMKFLIIGGYCVWEEQDFEDFQSSFSIPPSLLHLCKMYFRKKFRTKLDDAIKSLELPRSLVDVLLLEGIDTMKVDSIVVDTFGKIF